MINVKDVLFALLVAYVVMDISCTMMLKKKRPFLLKQLSKVSRKDCLNMYLCVGLSILAGAGTYYFVSKQ